MAQQTECRGCETARGAHAELVSSSLFPILLRSPQVFAEGVPVEQVTRKPGGEASASCEHPPG